MLVINSDVSVEEDSHSVSTCISLSSSLRLNQESHSLRSADTLPLPHGGSPVHELLDIFETPCFLWQEHNLYQGFCPCFPQVTWPWRVGSLRFNSVYIVTGFFIALDSSPRIKDIDSLCWSLCAWSLTLLSLWFAGPEIHAAVKFSPLEFVFETFYKTHAHHLARTRWSCRILASRVFDTPFLFPFANDEM